MPPPRRTPADVDAYVARLRAGASIEEALAAIDREPPPEPEQVQTALLLEPEPEPEPEPVAQTTLLPVPVTPPPRRSSPAAAPPPKLASDLHVRRTDVATYATPRNLERGTYADRYEAHHIAMTGHRYMPWQRQVVEVAGEHDAEGRHVYRKVVVKVPRQSGKTTLGDSVIVGRSMTWPDQASLLLLQDRNYSRKRLLDEIVDRRLAKNDAYLRKYKVRRQTGSEQVTFDNGSWVTIGAVTNDVGHSLVLDLAFIDEAWSHNDHRATQGISPTMITRPDPQLWIVSTEGTEESALLDYWTGLGRAAVEADEGGDVAYFEWSCPHGTDPYDEALWPAYMPALGHTVPLEAVRSEAATLPEGEFVRAYGNRRTPSVTSIVPEAAWQACGNVEHAPRGALHLGVDITPDRSSAAIVVCGEGCLEVIDAEYPVDGVVERIVALDRAHAFLTIAVDGAGPGATLITQLEHAGLRVTTVNAARLKVACGRFVDGVMSGQLLHRNQDALDVAVKAARKRTLLDAFAWTRRGATNISPLMAGTVAYWAHTETTEQRLDIY